LFKAANLTLKNTIQEKQQKNILRFFFTLLIVVRDAEQPKGCGENVEHLALSKELSIYIFRRMLSSEFVFFKPLYLSQL
jgi:hypothetical protein